MIMVWLIELLLFSTLPLIVGAENEPLTSLDYWYQVFPNTTMPENIRDLIPGGEKSGTDQRPLNALLCLREKLTSISLPYKFYCIDCHKNSLQPVQQLGRDFHWSAVVSSSRPYRWLWADIDREPGSRLPHDDSKGNFSSNISPIFFLENDLNAGSRMVIIIKSSQKSNYAIRKRTTTFLSDKDAQEFPFSISKYGEILRMFSIEPHSVKANLVKQTLDDCGIHSIPSETKYCAASLESMIKFAISQVGTNDIHVLSTSIISAEENMKSQPMYRIYHSGVKIESLKVVTCHPMVYPYAVFYCHKLGNSRLYTVPLIAEDGSSINTVAVCHSDTASWNPGHLSFRLLGIKPRTDPICHFLLESIAWIPKYMLYSNLVFLHVKKFNPMSCNREQALRDKLLLWSPNAQNLRGLVLYRDSRDTDPAC